MLENYKGKYQRFVEKLRGKGLRKLLLSKKLKSIWGRTTKVNVGQESEL